MREAPLQPTLRPVVVLACTVLVMTTAGMGMLMTFRGLAPWNGVAVGPIVLALATGHGGGASLRRHTGPRVRSIR